MLLAFICKSDLLSAEVFIIPAGATTARVLIDCAHVRAGPQRCARAPSGACGPLAVREAPRRCARAPSGARGSPAVRALLPEAPSKGPFLFSSYSVSILFGSFFWILAEGGQLFEYL